VDWIGAEVGGNVLALFQHARHPVAESRGFGGRFQVLSRDNATLASAIFY
jgi:hypothetical protein